MRRFSCERGGLPPLIICIVCLCVIFASFPFLGKIARSSQADAQGERRVGSAGTNDEDVVPTAFDSAGQESVEPMPAPYAISVERAETFNSTNEFNGWRREHPHAKIIRRFVDWQPRGTPNAFLITVFYEEPVEEEE